MCLSPTKLLNQFKSHLVTVKSPRFGDGKSTNLTSLDVCCGLPAGVAKEKQVSEICRRFRRYKNAVFAAGRGNEWGFVLSVGPRDPEIGAEVGVGLL